MAPRLYKQLGLSIRKRRDELGITQDALAKLVGLSRTSVTNVERGRQQMLVHQLVDFARVLKVEAKDLLGEIPPEPDIGLEAAIQEAPPDVQRLVARLRRAPSRKVRS